MKTHELFDDLRFILEHVYAGPEIAVRRWSQIVCSDYQIPLALVVSFFENAFTKKRSVVRPIRDMPEDAAFADILRNSNLNAVCEVDDAMRVVRYREGVPEALTEEIFEFIGKNVSGCD